MERQAADDHAQKCAAFLSLSTVLSLLMFPANIGHPILAGRYLSDIAVLAACVYRTAFLHPSAPVHGLPLEGASDWRNS